MKQKPQRYYEVTEDEQGVKTLNVYTHPNKTKAQASSHVSMDEMKFYRNNFKLLKVWTQEEVERNESLESF